MYSVRKVRVLTHPGTHCSAMTWGLRSYRRPCPLGLAGGPDQAIEVGHHRVSKPDLFRILNVQCFPFYEGAPTRAKVEAAVPRTSPLQVHRGVRVVNGVDCSTSVALPWFVGEYSRFITNRLIPAPIPAKGRLW